MGHAESKESKITPSVSTETEKKGLVPQRFVVTYKSSWSKLAVFISEPDAEPSYMINCAGASFGDMVLFNGPTKEYPPLANVKPTGKWAQDFKITLPELDGYPSHEEICRYKSHWSTERYWFAMEVGDGPNRHVENFEWRRSHSSEIKTFGRSKWGWKLVRLGSDESDPKIKDGEDRPDGLTTDGKEIVALWANGKVFKTMMTIGEFEFRNSGSTGELGRAWALMAMLTRICIWQKEYQAMTTAAVS